MDASGPSEYGSWIPLNTKARKAWLNDAHDRFFLSVRHRTTSIPGKHAASLDGRETDCLLGFFCALGESVNGPGGYFGRGMRGFCDCLYGGFGLDRPYTVTWAHSESARRMLGPNALVEYLASLHMVTDSGRLWYEETLSLAESGRRSLFDEVVDDFDYVPGATLILR